VSAFIVSKSHIDALVSVIAYGPKDSQRHDWRGISWSRPCEPYAPSPEYPQYVTDTKWMSLATGGLAELRKNDQEITGDELGFILWAENVASVHYRYPGEDIDTLPGTYTEQGQNEASQGYTFSRLGKLPTTIEAFKLISCLDYQSCEHPEWRESEAFRILEALKDALIGCLAGYSEAPWEWAA
jgi:hypothetical protein